MKRIFLTALLGLSLLNVSAQTAPNFKTGPQGQPIIPQAPTPPNMPRNQYDFSKLTPQQRAQAQAYFQAPKMVSNSLNYAINVLLNEPKGVMGLLGTNDRQLLTALERAAIHVPVRLVISSNRKLPLQRVEQHLTGPGNTTTILVTTRNVILIQQGKLSVWEGQMGADEARANMQPVLDSVPVTR